MWQFTVGAFVGSTVTLLVCLDRSACGDSPPAPQPDRVALLRCDDLRAERDELRGSLLLSQARAATLALELDAVRRQGTQFKSATDDDGERIPAPREPFPTR